jgi:hypothetical protein
MPAVLLPERANERRRLPARRRPVPAQVERSAEELAAAQARADAAFAELLHEEGTARLDKKQQGSSGAGGSGAGGGQAKPKKKKKKNKGKAAARAPPAPASERESEDEGEDGGAAEVAEAAARAATEAEAARERAAEQAAGQPRRQSETPPTPASPPTPAALELPPQHVLPAAETPFNSLEEMLESLGVGGPPATNAAAAAVPPGTAAAPLADAAAASEASSLLQELLASPATPAGAAPRAQPAALGAPDSGGAAHGVEVLPAALAPHRGSLAALMVCPLSGSLFTDPVIAADGLTYERAALKAWLRNSSASPATGAPLGSAGVRANWAVAALLRAVK